MSEKKIDERIKKFSESLCTAFGGCIVVNNSAKQLSGHDDCALAKNLHKFASEIVREIVPIRCSCRGDDECDHNIVINEFIKNARRIGIEVDK